MSAPMLEFLNLFILFIWNVSKETDKAPLCWPSNGHSNQSWARPKLGAKDATQVSHVGGRALIAWAIICCLPECTLAGSWNQDRAPQLICTYLDVLSLWMKKAAVSYVSTTTWGLSISPSAQFACVPCQWTWAQILDLLWTLVFCQFRLWEEAGGDGSRVWVSAACKETWIGLLAPAPAIVNSGTKPSLFLSLK